ncbi:MAG: efflux RND transporter permease subunit [Leptothrix sp. (in: b-proteobacteria)]
MSALFIGRPVATSLLTLGLALVGAIAFFLLPIAPLPQFDYPTISVSANLPGASADTMAATVATPLERALGNIAGVNEITSTSSLGSTRVTLQFDLNRDINAAARNVQAAINAARTLLPSGMPSNPSYRKVNPSDPPIMILALTSDRVPVSQLFDTASTVLAQRLAQVEGIGDVSLGGGALPAVRVALDPNKLAANSIALDQVRLAIVATNASRPKGVVEDGARLWQIGANDQARTAAEYAPIVLSYRNGAAVRLQDVAEVRDAVQDVRAYGLANGRPAILLMLQKAPGANVIQAVDEVQKLLPQLRASVPAGINIAVMMDRTITIRESLREVERTLALSIALVIVVVYAFLRRWRATLIPAVVVPVSLVGTFGVMLLCGYTIDNLSLMALTVATGFVVDDAIVVLENITRHLERGKTPLQAALDGAREIWFTVLSISLSLIAAFIPILYMGGIVGRLFREFAVVLAVSIIISMVVSLTTTPMMAARLLEPHGRADRAPTRLGRAVDRLLEALQRGYRHSLRWTLRHQPVALLALAGVLGLNVYLYGVIEKGFFPQQDTGRLLGAVVADQGSSFQSMKGKLDAFMDIVVTDPAVANVAAFTGGGQRNSAQVFVALKPLAERKISADAVIDRLRPRLGKVPGAALFMRTGQDIRIGGRPSSSEYQFTLQADELQDIATWEPRIRRAMSQLKVIEDVDGDRQDRGPQTSVLIDRDAATRLGLTMRNIDTTLNDAFGQRQVGVIYNTLNQYRVVMELVPQYLQSPDALKNLYVTASSGQQVPLASVARIESTLAPLSISHEKGTPATTLSFNLAQGRSLSEATDAIDNIVAELGVPVSVRGVFSGTANAFRDSLKSQPLLILAAVLTIYILLGMLYESLIHPITILSTLPSAGVGALLALLLFKTEFSVIAMIGVVLLIGIVKKNAIMMIDFAIAHQKHASAAGHALGAAPAIYRAAHLRLRPILMTTLAALFGALPLAFGAGIGAELRQPLGIAVVGGLVLSQLLTLYTTPVIFVTLDRLSHPLRRRKAKPARFPRALPTSV